MEKSLDKKFYFSDEIYHQELDNIFYSDWICCGREEDLDSAGSYKIFVIGDENLFIIKDKNNDIIEVRCTYDPKSKGCLLYTSPSPRDS